MIFDQTVISLVASYFVAPFKQESKVNLESNYILFDENAF